MYLNLTLNNTINYIKIKNTLNVLRLHFRLRLILFIIEVWYYVYDIFI